MKNSDKTKEQLIEEVQELRLKVASLAAEEKRRAMLDAIPDMFFRISGEGVLLDYKASKDFQSPVSGQECVGAKVHEVLPAAVAEDTMHYTTRALRTGNTQIFDYQLSEDGRPQHYEARVVRSGEDEVLAIVRDVTEQRRLEGQRRQAQKMEAIGSLTAGIAHEFNNIMTAIMGVGEVLQEEIDEDSPLRDYADMLTALSERASSLTGGLLAYSRKQATHPEPLDINESIRAVEKILSSTAGENIEIRVAIKDAELTVTADKAQMEHVLMNLAANAMEAMPDGGTLTIRSERVEFYKGFMAHQAYIAPGEYALIMVSDTGAGISKAAQSKIFEPFFTTKKNRTGLGLSMAYGIVKKHNGYIYVDSEYGKGTMLMVYLPVSREESVKKDSRPAPSGGSGKVLVAEDDNAVRRLIKQAVEKSGYGVITAADGEDAVRKFTEHGDDIDLLLFDIVLPKKNGFDAYEQIRKSHPDVKIIFMSGYLPDDARTNEILEKGHTFVSKPIEMQKLVSLVRNTLG